MKLYLIGHDYRYAVEQMLMTILPEERPEYVPGRPEGNRMEVRLSRGKFRTTATCRYYTSDGTTLGRAQVENSALTDPVAVDRHCQNILKNAIYRAVRASGRQRPAWGTLTGVRPGKVYCALLRRTGDTAQAEKRLISEYDVTPQRAALCRAAAEETVKADDSLCPSDVCLYVGIPFCPTRCAYCSFVSQSVEKSMKLIPPFLEALVQEIHAVAQQVKELGLRVVSIYMGGGTPTTLSADQLERLCSALSREFDLSALREYTVEAGRPDTITREKLETLRRHGVDRISVNPQTMSDSVLQVIGRKHTADDIVSALNLVRDVGGYAVNMDLIAGLPSDTVDGFRATLDRVLELQPENITVHTLSLKKGSRITLENTRLPSPEEVSRMLDYAGSVLSKAGYRPYYLYRQKFMSGGFENVGWCRPGTENLYNICIMEELCSILSMGGGGSTKLIRRDGERNTRLTDPKYPLEYIQNIERTCESKRQISEFYTDYRQNQQKSNG